jgi:hypothetical protein
MPNDYIPMEIALPVGALLLITFLVSSRRDRVRQMREERLEREAMLAQYEASLRRSGWAD